MKRADIMDLQENINEFYDYVESGNNLTIQKPDHDSILMVPKISLVFAGQILKNAVKTVKLSKDSILLLENFLTLAGLYEELMSDDDLKLEFRRNINLLQKAITDYKSKVTHFENINRIANGYSRLFDIE